MNGIKKNDNLQSNKSSPISNEKTPQKTEEDKIVWFTSPPIEKLKYAKLNSGKSTIKPETEISNIVKLIRKTEGLNNNNDSNENQREKILSQNSISNIWTNEISVNSNSSNLNSPSFHKHSHCLDSLFSPINKKSKLNHWNNGFKGKYLKKDIFSKKGSMLDIENSLLFKKDRSNNFIDKNKNIFIYNNDTESNNNLLHNSNSSIQKKERIKSEPNLYHSPEAEINKKNIRIPKYNTLLNFEKIPFNKTNINFEQLNNTIFSDDSILGKRKYKDIDTSKNDTKDGKNINMIDYTIYKNQENKVLDILKLESNNNINNSNNSNNNELSNSSNKENSKINNNTNNENLMDISRINKVNKGKERSYESYEYNNKLNYKGFNINEEEENNKNIKSQHNANNDIIGVNNELLSASSIKNVFNNKKVKVELSENKNESLGSSILFSNDIINNDMKTDIKQENYCKKNDDFDDEFGFFDINIFNEEISEIVSKYDNVNNPLSQTGNPKSDLLQNNILNDKDDDDENIKKKKYFRFLVIEVLIKNDRKELRLYDKDNYSYESYAILCDEWYNTNVSPGNYVNIIGEFDENSHRCYITNDKNIIIVNPDVLLSVTIASSGYRCIRKPVLDNRVHSDEMNSNLVYGIILHELLQIAFQNNNFTTEFLDKSVTKLISKNIEKLYCIDETEDTAYTTLKEMIPKYQTWASTYVSSHPKVEY
ncbi:Dna2-domain-containing protein [Piromyces finnis]|uniref:Dna2-domain-containing protein n=1 Tax=Piromyces finnis TaxID=1754191 RepID=A0A1Y1UYX9_9FUNG|nr:Dna2-domain-containing protein [Piromyces finnis]|eukprot:ORX43608.1 Dna2-domain-containing protein [Piromyces finnis]